MVIVYMNKISIKFLSEELMTFLRLFIMSVS